LRGRDTRRLGQSHLMLYSAGTAPVGGMVIAEVPRRVWDRLIRKQWLILYPLAVSVINTAAFLVIYAFNGEVLGWSEFFSANFDRWEYVRGQFISTFSFDGTLALACAVGLAATVLTAMIRAPFFRAVAGPGYPRAPHNWREIANLAAFYLFMNLVLMIRLAMPAGSVLEQVVALAAIPIFVLFVFADYVIVYEGIAFLPALRRSIQLFLRRWLVVTAIFIVVQVIFAGVFRLYEVSYQHTDGISIILPVSQIVIESLMVLLFDLTLIFLYDRIRKEIPPRETSRV